MTHHEKIRDILVKATVLSVQDDFAQIEKEAQQNHVDLEEKIAEIKNQPTESIYQLVARGFGTTYTNLDGVTLDPSLITVLPESIVQTHQIVVFERDAAKQLLSVATRDPDDIQTLDFIQKKTGLELKVYYTDSASVQHIVKQYHQTLEAEIATLTEAPIDEQSYSGITALNRIARDIPIVKVVDTLLNYAIYQNASDIHIEPTEKDVIVRYRIDGILVDAMSLPKALQSPLLARIKVLSNLKIDEHRLPQDGRFKIQVDDNTKVAFRVSILPVYDGEKAVLRLLDESAKVLTFEQLGVHPDGIEILERNIAKPNGILLVTGPTGSGKTTTLYSVLNQLNTAKVNISTVEDPIEYRIPRVNQSQVNPKIGFTFAGGLRSLLRQDPNIIMVGEIRDAETAEIAAHAAMTGHLVLSTLHTNDAVGAIPRLTEMDVPHYLVASTTNLIVAQRLVRKICEHCRITIDVNKELMHQIEQQFKFQDILDTLKKYGDIEADTEAHDLHFYKGKGCQQCGGRGYKGRVGVYEILEINEELRRAILEKKSAEELQDIAIAAGMMTMAQDGFLKAKAGVTTIDEILRVTKE